MKHVEIYTGPLCAFCDRAKALLNKKGVSFKEIDLASDPNKMEEMIKKTNGMRTVPQIFINGLGDISIPDILSCNTFIDYLFYLTFLLLYLVSFERA